MRAIDESEVLLRLSRSRSARRSESSHPHPYPHRLLSHRTYHDHSEDPRIAKVTFTGSGLTGKKVAQAAAKNLRPVDLELGGKGALIVFEDAKVKESSMTVVRSRLHHL